jgi:hypothetical protein
VGAIAGLSVLGRVRAARGLLRPLNTIHAGSSWSLVPRVPRPARTGPARRLMMMASGLLALGGAGDRVGLALPDSRRRPAVRRLLVRRQQPDGLMGLAMITAVSPPAA